MLVNFVPVQLPELLGDRFAQEFRYREYHPTGLADVAYCVWTVTVGETVEPAVNIILPDGCVDIVVDLSKGTADFAAFSKATEEFEISGPSAQIGVRMKPGVFHALFGVPASEVMDTTIPFADLECETALDGVLGEGTPMPVRVAGLANYLVRKSTKLTPSAVMQELPRIYSNSLCRVDDIAGYLGYGVRQVSRLFLDEIGVTPRVFLNIVRLHRSLHLLTEDPDNTLAGLAIEAGFFDQSHFVREIKRHTGVSPLEIRRRMISGSKA